MIGYIWRLLSSGCVNCSRCFSRSVIFCILLSWSLFHVSSSGSWKIGIDACSCCSSSELFSFVGVVRVFLFLGRCLFSGFWLFSFDSYCLACFRVRSLCILCICLFFDLFSWVCFFWLL